MTVIQHGISEQPYVEQPTSPGPRLREVRLVQKMSIDEVSAHLHLDRKVIDALENDDYEQLSEPTFVRGYLRGYARLLNLPPAPIIEAYDRHGFAPPNLVPDIASKPQAKSSDISVRLATYMVVAILVVLMVIWWQTQKNMVVEIRRPIAETSRDNIPPVPQTERESGLEQNEPAPVKAIPAQDGSEPEETVSAQEEPVLVITPPAETIEGESEGTAASEMESMEEQLPPEGGRPLAEEAPGDRVATPSPHEDSAEVQSPAAAVTSVVEGEPPEAAAREEEVLEPPGVESGRGTLAIHFKYDSWLEINDKSGKKLFFELARAGQTVSLEGEAPLKVLLGYARGARIEYNGAPFDHGPFTKNQVARFTLGAVGDAGD